MYDDIEIRCINLAGKVNALSSGQWSDTASKAGESRTQEAFINDIMTTYQQAVTHRDDTYSVATWLGGTDFGIGALESQFTAVMAYLPAGSLDAVNNLAPFVQGPVTRPPNTVDVFGFWGGVFKDKIKKFLRGMGIDLDKLKPPGITQETFDSIVVYSIAAIIGWVFYKTFIK